MDLGAQASLPASSVWRHFFSKLLFGRVAGKDACAPRAHANRAGLQHSFAKRRVAMTKHALLEIDSRGNCVSRHSGASNPPRDLDARLTAAFGRTKDHHEIVA